MRRRKGDIPPRKTSATTQATDVIAIAAPSTRLRGLDRRLDILFRLSLFPLSGSTRGVSFSPSLFFSVPFSFDRVFRSPFPRPVYTFHPPTPILPTDYCLLTTPLVAFVKGGKGGGQPSSRTSLVTAFFHTLVASTTHTLIPDSPSSNVPVLHLSTFANLSHAFHELLRVGPTLPFLLFGPYTYTINTRVPPIPRNGARLHKEGGEETIEDLEPENPHTR